MVDYDLIIVGGGPAGLTAGIYAARGGKKVAIIEKIGIGGQAALTDKIENYPAFQEINGYDLMNQMHEQATALNVATILSEVKSIAKTDDGFVLKTRRRDYSATAVIIATGAKPQRMGIENDSAAGVSYCATCDGGLYKGKIVTVIGGGNTAVNDAIYLSNLATKVYLVHRRDQFRASQILVDSLKKLPNVELVLSCVPKRVVGNPVSGLVVGSVNTNEERELITDAVFVAVGQNPQSEFASDLIQLDGRGYILGDKQLHTNVEGIFVAGDVRDTVLRQIVTACADGAIAAEQAVAYIASIKK